MTLKQLRQSAGKSVKEVAEKLNIKISTYYNYEQGVRQINIRQVLLLSELFEEPAEEIIKAQLNSQYDR